MAWNEDKVLTEEIKGFDRTAVRAFPEILAKADLEVYGHPKKVTFSRRKRKQ